MASRALTGSIILLPWCQSSEYMESQSRLSLGIESMGTSTIRLGTTVLVRSDGGFQSPLRVGLRTGVRRWCYHGPNDAGTNVVAFCRTHLLEDGREQRAERQPLRHNRRCVTPMLLLLPWIYMVIGSARQADLCGSHRSCVLLPVHGLAGWPYSCHVLGIRSYCGIDICRGHRSPNGNGPCVGRFPRYTGQVLAPVTLRGPPK